MHAVIAVVLVTSCRSRPSPSPPDAALEGVQPALEGAQPAHEGAQPASGCDRIRELQRSACAAWAAAWVTTPEAAGYPSSWCELQCETTTPKSCVEHEGAWGIVVDEVPCEDLRPEKDVTWRLVHFPPGESSPRFSAKRSSPGSVSIDLVDGRVRVQYQGCLTDPWTSSGDTTHTCEGVATGSSTLDCPDGYRLRRPRGLPEDMREGLRGGVWAPDTRWDKGSREIRFERVAGKRQMAVELAPLVLWDGDVGDYYFAGPTWYGRIEPDKTVGFDGDEEIAKTRDECRTLPSPSKAPPKDLWRSALCARLLGKSVPWIVDQWARRCAGLKLGEGAGSDTLEVACLIDAYSRKARGVPKFAVHYLGQVTPLPKEAPPGPR